MDDSWAYRKRSKKRISLIIFLCILTIFLVILLINNYDILFPKKSTIIENNKQILRKEKQEKQNKKIKKTEKIKRSIENSSGNKTTAIGLNKTKEFTDKSFLSVKIPNINCTLANKNGLHIQVSLVLYCKDENLKKEIIFKRSDIKLIVKKVFSQKKLSEINKDNLKIELKEEINDFLEHGKINYIDLLDFIPVEK